MASTRSSSPQFGPLPTPLSRRLIDLLPFAAVTVYLKR